LSAVGTETTPSAFDADVVVVGQGPVGALAALLLGRLGVRCVAVDRRADIYPLPRAVAADEEVQRMLWVAGLSETVRRMLPSRGARFLDRHGRSMLDVAMPGSDTGRPGVALFRQPELERDLREQLADVGAVNVVLGDEGRVLDVAQDATGVELRMHGGARLRSRYVIACDGASSPLRALLGVPFVGGSFSQSWLVVDTLAGTSSDPEAWVEWHCDRRRPAVVVPGHHGSRVEVLLDHGRPGLPRERTARRDRDAVAMASDIAATYVGRRAAVERATTYLFADRTAGSWRVGRVLFAGDAAHTMPPFAGQGMAAGVRDVTNLAWKLRLVLGGVAGPDLLDTYEAERRPHLRQMTRLTRLAGSLITPTSRPVAAVRDTGLRTVGRVPGLGAVLREGRIKPPQRVLGSAAAPLVVGARGGGSFVASPTVAGGGPTSARLDDVRGTGFTLVGVGLDPRSVLTRTGRTCWERAGTTYVEMPSGDALGAEAGTVAIVRPDSVLRDVVPARQLSEATATYFGALRAGRA
jgi:3-(3-hydroxy-phenyl)propionate hydroxylase